MSPLPCWANNGTWTATRGDDGEGPDFGRLRFGPWPPAHGVTGESENEMDPDEQSKPEIVVVENRIREDRTGRVVLVRGPIGTPVTRMRRAARKACRQNFIYAHRNRSLEKEEGVMAFELSNLDTYRGSH